MLPLALLSSSLPIAHSFPYSYWSICAQGKYPVLMRKRINNESREEIVIDQNDIAKNHRYVGVMNERMSRDDGQVKVAFAVDTDGHQRWQVMTCTPRARIRISNWLKTTCAGLGA